jgi:hypothetical protein
MSVQDVVDGVVEVLSRAESLFAAPADPVAEDVTAAIGDATNASAAIGARTDELGGVLASAHHDALDTISRRLQGIGDTDLRLVEHLTAAAGVHANGTADAADLRRAAQELPSRLGPTGELPVSELAALLALRNQVADMQRLIAEHASHAARAAEIILGSGYQP